MSPDTTIDSVYEEYKRFTLFEREGSSEEQEKETGCVYARQLQVCLNEFCQKALTQPTRLSINEAYLFCFLKFMEWRAAVPKRHRNQMNERSHYCIWHAMEESYLRLKRVELMLPETVIFLPPAVLPPPPLLPPSFIQE